MENNDGEYEAFLAYLWDQYASVACRKYDIEIDEARALRILATSDSMLQL